MTPASARVIGLRRAPEQVAVSFDWPLDSVALTDALGLRRDRPVCRPASPAAARRRLHSAHSARRADASGALVVGEALLTLKGTLALRGPMVVTDQAGRTRSTPATRARRDRARPIRCDHGPPGRRRCRSEAIASASATSTTGRGPGRRRDADGARLTGFRAIGSPAMRCRCRVPRRNAAADMGLWPLVEDVFREAWRQTAARRRSGTLAGQRRELGGNTCITPSRRVEAFLGLR